MEKFKIDYDYWTVELEIDPTKISNFKEQLMFWGGGEYWIARERGDVKIAFIKLLARELVRMSMDYNLKGIIKEFENKEGWLPLNIEHGVRVLSIDDFTFDEDNFYVTQLDDEE